MNRLGLCMTYNELERIDIELATRSIESARENSVSVPENIENSIAIHGAMDNFDDEKGTQSGIGSSHDTILMLFQNAYDSVDDHCLEISKQPSNASSDKRSLEHILNSQKLVRYGQFSRRGEIPLDFQTKNDSVGDQIKIAASEKYKTWLLARHLVKLRVPELSNKVSSGVPSVIASNSLLETNYVSITRV